MNNNKRKKLICTTALLATLLVYPYKKEYNPKYKILNDPNGPFASYSLGYIYIGSRSYLLDLPNVGPNDVLIEDQRYFEDPNMSIYQSYNIVDKDIRNEILEVICIYEQIYPSKWDRTIDSMRLEWFCHNLSYNLNYKTEKSCDVDLNNDDESKYSSKVLQRIFRL